LRSAIAPYFEQRRISGVEGRSECRKRALCLAAKRIDLGDLQRISEAVTGRYCGKRRVRIAAPAERVIGRRTGHQPTLLVRLKFGGCKCLLRLGDANRRAELQSGSCNALIRNDFFGRHVDFDSLQRLTAVHQPLLKRNDKRCILAGRRQQAVAVLTSDPGLQLIPRGMPR
jgi:hypothetical protein